ncbi:MAG: hypothetical protein ACLP5V_09930 [Candidatus Bathyarchaeia archaeon]
MDAEEFLPLLISAAVSIQGRTAVQKLGYFASIVLGLDLGYTAHYYGPYSPLLASYLQNFVGSDYIEESGRQTALDRVVYSYSMTDDGSALAKQLQNQHAKEFAIIKQIVEKCQEIAGGNTNVLSWAAKVHYILSAEKTSITSDQAVSIAKTFGWKLSEEEVKSGVKLLTALSLAVAESN